VPACLHAFMPACLHACFACVLRRAIYPDVTRACRGSECLRVTFLAAACLAGVAYVCLRAQPEHAVHQESIGIFTVLGASRNSSMILFGPSPLTVCGCSAAQARTPSSWHRCPGAF
jgi:nitrate reductase gamma subunit